MALGEKNTKEAEYAHSESNYTSWWPQIQPVASDTILEENPAF